VRRREKAIEVPSLASYAYLIIKGHKLRELYELSPLEIKFLIASHEIEDEEEAKALKRARLRRR